MRNWCAPRQNDLAVASASDHENIALVTSPAEVDRINAEFYGAYPYPWRPLRLERLLDRNFSRRLLCQAFGDWGGKSIPEHADMWVAGCGTNQAAITALNFPSARVVGSDISRPSLDLCARTASELHLNNLTLRQESLNDDLYKEKFDYILCTGVIHHTADPSVPLRRIAAALKRTGVLELMVYNRFHRTLTTAFQKAVRILAGQESGVTPGSPDEMAIATAIVSGFPVECQMRSFLEHYKESQRVQFADALMQPVEYSYTVESLNALATSCGLELLVPAVSMFDRAAGSFRWNLRFPSEELDKRYGALDDLRRWQVTNLLLAERSPMLWFYLRRSDSEIPRVPEKQVCETFLDSCFVRAETMKQPYLLAEEGCYVESGGPIKFPVAPAGTMLGRIVAAADGKARMRDILDRLGVCGGMAEAADLRLQLTVPAFPYLIVRDGETAH